jgi:hypothetical protein
VRGQQHAAQLPAGAAQISDKTAINYTGEKRIEKLLQFRTTQKTKPFFSIQKSEKSSHPSGEETAPEGLQTFRGTDFFGHMSKNFRVTAQKNADFCQTPHRVTRPLDVWTVVSVEESGQQKEMMYHQDTRASSSKIYKTRQDFHRISYDKFLIIMIQ